MQEGGDFRKNADHAEPTEAHLIIVCRELPISICIWSKWPAHSIRALKHIVKDKDINEACSYWQL